MSPTEGAIALFDILGYSNLLQRNEPEQIAETIIPLLKDIQRDAISTIQDLVAITNKAGPKAKTISDDMLKDLGVLIFSDTILLNVSLANLDDASYTTRWFLFLATAISLEKKMFLAGLPLRGAISYGKYLIDGACLAGRPIVEAYNLSNSLELSACALSNSTANAFNRIDKYLNIIKYSTPEGIFFHHYRTPTKNGDIDLQLLAFNAYEPNYTDPGPFVRRAFSGHKKEIPPNVLNKVENTIQWHEFLRAR